MVHIPVPVPRLCLSLAFDIEGSNERPSYEKHDAAIKEAAKVVDQIINFSKHGVTPDAFSAKVIDGTNIDLEQPMNLNSAHNISFDPNFHVAYGGPAVRYEFIYYDDHGTIPYSCKLFLRIVTSFGKPEETIDGVLATRIGLTALEILEGNEVHPTIFPNHQPPSIGIRMISNFLYHNIIFGILAIPIGYIQFYIYSLLETMGIRKEGNIFRVNSVVTLLKFHTSKYCNESANYHIYRTEAKGAFKTFLNVVEKWKEDLGLDGSFYLLNSSPLAAPAITSNIKDIANIATRNRGAFAPAGPPPDEDVWKIVNFAVASKIAINNYGSHKHNFSAKPISFIWDWLDVRNSVTLAACITVNGVFMSCFRALENSLEKLKVPKETFPTPPTKAIANSTWRTTMH